MLAVEVSRAGLTVAILFKIRQQLTKLRFHGSDVGIRLTLTLTLTLSVRVRLFYFVHGCDVFFVDGGSLIWLNI
jgi:hypothetical protein